MGRYIIKQIGKLKQVIDTQPLLKWDDVVCSTISKTYAERVCAALNLHKSLAKRRSTATKAELIDIFKKHGL